MPMLHGGSSGRLSWLGLVVPTVNAMRAKLDAKRVNDLQRSDPEFPPQSSIGTRSSPLEMKHSLLVVSKL
jgi:hypothetical protein